MRWRSQIYLKESRLDWVRQIWTPGVLASSRPFKRGGKINKLWIEFPNFVRWKRTWSSIIWQNLKIQFKVYWVSPRDWRVSMKAYFPRHDSIFRLTVDIKIHRTPLMESNFTYVCEHHLIRLRFQYHCKRSSGSWIRRHGVRIPLLWPMYHILHHSIQYRLVLVRLTSRLVNLMVILHFLQAVSVWQLFPAHEWLSCVLRGRRMGSLIYRYNKLFYVDHCKAVVNIF